MFKSPYDTTAIPAYDTKALTMAIETAKAEGALVSGLVPDAPSVLAIINDSNVPLIAHPISFTSVLDNKLYTAVDLRPYRSQLRRVSEKNVEIPNSGPIPFNLMRARLQQIWNLPSPPDLFNLSTLPQSIYSVWVADTLADALRLDLEIVFSIRVLAAFWYQCQFDTEPQRTLDESELTLIATTINRSTRIPLERCFECLEPYGKTITNTGEFVEALKTLNGVRLNRISVGLVYTTLATSWFGSTAVREVVSVAVEYPPTFLAMLWSAIHERTYRNTPIAKLVLRFGRDGASQSFTNALGLALRTNEG